MRNNWFKLSFITFICTIFLIACGTADEPETTDKEGGLASEQVITFTETSTIPGMDTTQETDTVSFNVMNNVFEGLYRINLEQMPEPAVASGYEMSEDGLVYTFDIREEAVWSNGDPVTANDFVFAWRKVLNPETLSPYADILSDIQNATRILDNEDELYGNVEELGVRAIDERTLEVTLEQPIPYFISLTTFPTFFPQNEAFVTEQGQGYAQDVASLIYNGPFFLTEWKHEQGWTYKKNPDYWDRDAVKLEQVNVKVIKDVAAATRLYETGETDRVLLSSEYVDQYQNHEHFHTMQEPTLFFLRFNQKNEALGNVNIRKAIANAWNKEGLTAAILNNGSIPAYFFVPKKFVYGPDGEDFREGLPEYHNEGIEKAKQYWQTGLKEIGKDNVTLELLNFDSENSKTIGEYLKNQLETNLEGLTVNIKPQPFGQKIELEDALNYDMSFSGWGPDYPDPMTYMYMFLTGGGSNNMDFSNKKYDELVKGAQVDLSDLEQRWRDLQEAERVLLEDEAAISPMYQRGVAYLQQPYIKDFVIHPVGAEKSFKWAYIEGK